MSIASVVSRQNLALFARRLVFPTTRRPQRLWFSSYPPHQIVGLPSLSPTMDSGSISNWNVNEGDAFAPGDVFCSVETDKATVDFEAQDEGVVARILAQAGSGDIKVGDPIMITVESEDDVAAFKDYVVQASAAAPSSSPPPPAAAVAPTAPPAAVSAPAASTIASGSSFLMPSARHLSQSKGLDATGLVGTGKGGRVTKEDVIKAIAAGSLPPLSTASTKESPSVQAAAAAAPSPSFSTAAAAPSTQPIVADLPLPEIETTGSFEDITNNKMRKIIASRLTESKRDVPHFYTAMEVELDQVLKLRKKLAAMDVKVSVNDFVIRCCALALRDVPEVNGTYDAKSNTVKLQDSIDISVAVATPTGLITPIVFGTDKLGLSEITETIRDLAGRAREGKLAPHEYQGGSFSVSNLGMFGIDEFSAVINPPQAAILAVGGGSRRVVPTPFVDGPEKQTKPAIKTIMTARLSADRRVVDEATASLFMSAFRHYINEPELLML